MEREVSNFVHTNAWSTENRGNYLDKLRDWVAWTKKNKKSGTGEKKTVKNTYLL